MIYIVHGDNLAKSRLLITNQQKKVGIETKTETTINDVTPSQIYELGASTSLFGEPPFVVIDITGFRKQSADDYITTLKKLPATAHIILLAQKTLPKSNPFLAAVTTLDAKVIVNTIEDDSNIFRLADYVFSKNRTASYKELYKLSGAGTDNFYIFSMLLFGLRGLFNYIYDSPKVAKLKEFQLAKFKKQAAGFSQTTIKMLFYELYELEKKAKTGLLDPELFVTCAVEKVLNS